MNQYKTISRSIPEKFVCFFIFLMFSFSIESILFWIFSYSNWNSFLNLKAITFKNFYITFYTVFFIFTSFSIWSIWKNHSFKKFKLEISFFLIIYILSILWNYLFLIKQDFFLSLICGLFILFFSIALNLLIWKKEKTSALFFLFCSLWNAYLLIINMSFSITSF
jgi:tryptophan-rich sensory protein